MKKANYIISIITVAFGVAFLIYGKQFAISLDGTSTAASWPNILSWILIGLGVILAIYNTVSKMIPESKIDFKSYEFKCVLIVIAMVIALLVIWYYLGTLIALALFIPAFCYFLGERNWLVLVGYDAAVILFIYIIFEKVLNSPLSKPIFM